MIVEAKGRKYGDKPETERRCIINGLQYRFTSVHTKQDGYTRGYYPKRKEWAILKDEYIMFDDCIPVKVDRWID